MCRQDFDGDVAIQLGVAGAIDLAHRAGAKGADDFVDAKTRAGLERHWGGSIAVAGEVRALDDGWRPPCVRSAQATRRAYFLCKSSESHIDKIDTAGHYGRAPCSPSLVVPQGPPRFTVWHPWCARVGRGVSSGSVERLRGEWSAEVTSVLEHVRQRDLEAWYQGRRQHVARLARELDGASEAVTVAACRRG